MADRVTHYPPEAVLIPEQFCEWLGICLNTLRRLGIRRVSLTKRNTLYFARDVYEFLEEQAE
jgi:hypothetical protein